MCSKSPCQGGFSGDSNTKCSVRMHLKQGKGSAQERHMGRVEGGGRGKREKGHQDGGLGHLCNFKITLP